MVLNHEIPVILNYHGLASIYFWFLMMIGGICGFAIGFFTGLQIKVPSPSFFFLVKQNISFEVITEVLKILESVSCIVH